MMRKNYILKESSLQILQGVMEKRGLKSETAALEFILADYARRDSLASEIGDVLTERFLPVIKSIKATSALGANNSEVLMDCINTMLQERGSARCYTIDSEPSPVMLDADEARKQRAAKRKQKQDNRKGNE